MGVASFFYPALVVITEILEHIFKSSGSTMVGRKGGGGGEQR